MESEYQKTKNRLIVVKGKILDIKSRRDKLHDFNEFIRGRHYNDRKNAITAFDKILSNLEVEEKILNERLRESE